MSIRPRLILLLGLIVLVTLSACTSRSTAEAPTASLEQSLAATPLPPSQTAPPATATPLPPTSTAVPSATPTASPSPTASPTPTETTTPSVTPGTSGGAVTGSVLFFLIRQGSGGPICGDSAIPVATLVRRSGDIARDVEAGLKLLFSIEEKMVQDLYNPLYKANLKVVEVSFEAKTGLIEVYIRGVYPQPKDPCDNTRVREQVWQTVKQFEEVKATNIFLNGYPFGDKLSNGK